MERGPPPPQRPIVTVFLFCAAPVWVLAKSGKETGRFESDVGVDNALVEEEAAV